MRIAIDARPLQSASRLRGIGTYTRNLIQFMFDDGHDVVLIVWDTNKGFESLENNRFPLPPPKIRVLGWHRDRNKLNDLFLKLADEVDLIHFTSPFELDMSWPGIELGIPKIVTVHDLMPVTHADLILTGKHKLLKPIFAKQASWLSAADGLISVSEATAESLKKTIPDLPPIKVIPHGTPHNFARSKPEVIEAYRKKMQLPEKFILYFGGLSRNKNVETLIEALHGKNLLPLIVAGAGTEDETKRLINKYKDYDVRWLGRVPAPDVMPLYSAATLFVMPSLVEGFGLPIIEAMGCGTPVACSNISSLPEAAGDCAAFFNPHDKDNIARVISETLANPSRMEELVKRGLERAKNFTFRKTAEKTWEAYHDFANQYLVKHGKKPAYFLQ
ncbi:MAG: glycosyltransferase family 4 protein [bacterium]|nr:glycosyltransferase family 4 protein [bacterium]